MKYFILSLITLLASCTTTGKVPDHYFSDSGQQIISFPEPRPQIIYLPVNYIEKQHFRHRSDSIKFKEVNNF